MPTNIERMTQYANEKVFLNIKFISAAAGNKGGELMITIETFS